MNGHPKTTGTPGRSPVPARPAPSIPAAAMAVVAVITLARACPAPALAQARTSFLGKIRAQKLQRDDVSKKITTTGRTIVVLETQLQRLTRELKENHRNKAETEKEINRLNRELARSAAEIEQLRSELAKARKRHDRYHAEFCKRLVHYHRMKNRPLLGLLFNSRNLTDLVRRFRYYSFLSREDTETLYKLQKSRDELAARKADLERREIAQSQLKRRLERRNAALLKLIEDQDRLMVRVRQEKLQAERRVKKLRRAHAYLSRKISNLQRAQSLLDESTSRGRSSRRAAAGKVVKGSLDWPIDGDISIIRPFGYSENMVGTDQFSAGIDIAISSYTVVKAAADGTVVFRGPFSPTYGNIVMLDHGGAPNNVFTIYGNLDQIFVPRKKFVKRGEPIGSVGARAALEDRTGSFHFEIRRKTTPVDPLEWLKTRSSGDVGRTVTP